MIGGRILEESCDLLLKASTLSLDSCRRSNDPKSVSKPDLLAQSTVSSDSSSVEYVHSVG